MKIIVPFRPFSFKLQIDKRTRKLIPDTSRIDINPSDKIALATALDLRRTQHDAEIVAVTVGGESSEQILMEALVDGVDNAVLIQTHDEGWIGQFTIAWLLAATYKHENCDFAVFGSHSADGLSGEIAGLVAGLLKVKIIPEVESIVWTEDELTIATQEGKQLRSYRVGNARIFVLSSNLKRAKRFPSLWNIHRAFAGKLEKISPSDLKLEPSLESFSRHVKTVSFTEEQEEESPKLRISGDSPDMARLVIREVNRALGRSLT